MTENENKSNKKKRRVVTTMTRKTDNKKSKEKGGRNGTKKLKSTPYSPTLLLKPFPAALQPHWREKGEKIRRRRILIKEKKT